MRKTELTFAEGFLGIQARLAKDKPVMVFDFDKAAQIIKDRLKEHPNLIADAGLQRDFNNTCGTIFENGKPQTDGGCYLASNWAIPTLILSWDGEEMEEIECYVLLKDSRFNANSDWDEESLEILGIKT